MGPSLPYDANTSIAAQAALYAAGAIPTEEMQSLAQQDAVGDHLGDWDHTVERLADVVPAIEPAPAIKQRLLERIAREATDAASEPVVVRRDEGWRPMGPPGLSYRLLFADAARQRMTIQMRAEAGSRIPAHKHRGVEECLVMEGDLSDGDRTYFAGDYFRCAEGSRHEDQTTVNGCVCVLITALNPLLLSAAS
ncbi:MAG: cupin domain-containing protein [Planctomycetaceae bacterium]|nr:cupin domain-containing protein [Planctomycetaceae bacterium]